jgi:hypothetical protein
MMWRICHRSIWSTVRTIANMVAQDMGLTRGTGKMQEGGIRTDWVLKMSKTCRYKGFQV